MKWRRLKFYYHVLRTALSQLFFRSKIRKRTENFVSDEYNDDYRSRTNQDFLNKREWSYQSDCLVQYPVIDHKKFLISRFAAKLNELGIESLLELGSGRGFNVLALVGLVPTIQRIRGVELTKAGVMTAQKNLADLPVDVLVRLTGLSQEVIRKRVSECDIEFVEGSIRKLPFSDGEFDAVFSNSVIEQIPDDYNLVFSEASRVSKLAGFFSEPFYEANKDHPFERLYLKNIDYFRWPINSVVKSGWKIVSFEVPSLQKFVFKTGLLSCLKSSANEKSLFKV